MSFYNYIPCFQKPVHVSLPACIVFVPCFSQFGLSLDRTPVHAKLCRNTHVQGSLSPLGQSKAVVNSLPAEIGPLGWFIHCRSVLSSLRILVTCIFSTLVVVIICKEIFPLTVQFEQNSERSSGSARNDLYIVN